MNTQPQTFKKDKRINIRISTSDLAAIQRRALENGIPYQTLVASILHKYVSGGLYDVTANKSVNSDRMWNVGRATVLSLPDISTFDEGTTVDKPIVVSYLTIEMSGINSMPDLS